MKITKNYSRIRMVSFIHLYLEIFHSGKEKLGPRMRPDIFSQIQTKIYSL